MRVSPCKDCAERHPCCHDSCGKYGAWKDERDAVRDWNRKQHLWVMYIPEIYSKPTHRFEKGGIKK